MPRFIHVDENEDGTCTMTTDGGCLVTFPCSINELAIGYFGSNAERARLVAERTIHTHIPDTVGPCERS